MRQSYLKNAALMTGADVLLRLAGMGLRIYLANALGGEGMGLYQLVLAVYALFVTLATAGVSVAATRLMAEELSRGRAEARGMLARLLAAGLGLGVFAMAAQLGLAGLAAAWWLGDARAAGALRAAAFGMPWMAVSAVLRGFFIARRRVEPNVLSQLAEQTVRIGVVYVVLEQGILRGWDHGRKCTAVLAATALSEEIGEMRITTRITPRIRENRADHKVSSILTRNAPSTSYWLKSSRNPLIRPPLLRPGWAGCSVRRACSWCPWCYR